MCIHTFVAVRLVLILEKRCVILSPLVMLQLSLVSSSVLIFCLVSPCEWSMLQHIATFSISQPCIANPKVTTYVKHQLSVSSFRVPLPCVVRDIVLCSYCMVFPMRLHLVRLIFIRFCRNLTECGFL